IWAWRADHGADASWSGNVALHGLVVNGDNVTALGLAVEHFGAVPMPGDNASGLGSYPGRSAAIYRHIAEPGTFNSSGMVTSNGIWGNPNLFYLETPADFYAQFWHQNAINYQQYGFPYDDSGGYSSDVSCTSPQTLVVAVGW
ncbi:MAG: beta-1,3-glucanase family protein, partial [Terracidiphilus sp.]